MIDGDTRSKIIDAAILCVGEKGIQNVTTRTIAEYAGVNLALINYYFGTKEELMDEAIRRSLDTYLSDFLGDNVDGKDERATARESLSLFVHASLQDAISSPQIAKSYMHGTLYDSDYDTPFIERLCSFLTRLDARFTGDMSERDSAKNRLALTQIVSSVLFIGLMPDFFGKFLGVDLKDKKQQKKYIESLLESHYPTGSERDR